MKILALEFSSGRRSVAVIDGGEVRGQAQESGARGTGPLGLIETTLRTAGLQPQEPDCLAVGLGPGSYTGIRLAIALAQGWQLALGTTTLGISSLECLARQAQAEKISGPVNLVIDAQRKEFYLVRYDIGPVVCREIEPLRLACLEEIRARAQTGELIIGPDADRWFSTGRPLFPDAAVLGQLALCRRDFVPAEKLEPIYLRETAFVKAPPPCISPAA